MSKRQKTSQVSLFGRQFKVPLPIQTSIPIYRKNTSRTIKCWNEFWSGTAVWARVDGIWFCSFAEASLSWMIGLDKVKAKLEMIRRGCSWEWSEIKSENSRVSPNNGTSNAALPKSSKVSVPLESGFQLHPMTPNDALKSSSVQSCSPPTEGALCPI